MPKNISRLKQGKDILANSTHSEWCSVNIHNEFTFHDKSYVIDENEEDYKVYNKAWEIDDYTNESKMDKVLAVLEESGEVSFYSQSYDYLKVWVTV